MSCEVNIKTLLDDLLTKLKKREVSKRQQLKVFAAEKRTKAWNQYINRLVVKRQMTGKLASSPEFYSGDFNYLSENELVMDYK
jgi:hypothetical protein